MSASLLSRYLRLVVMPGGDAETEYARNACYKTTMHAREHSLVIAVLLGVAGVAHLAEWPSAVTIACATGITAELVMLALSRLWPGKANHSFKDKS
jgi:hypothetical protein